MTVSAILLSVATTLIMPVATTDSEVRSVVRTVLGPAQEEVARLTASGTGWQLTELRLEYSGHRLVVAPACVEGIRAVNLDTLALEEPEGPAASFDYVISLELENLTAFDPLFHSEFRIVVRSGEIVDAYESGDFFGAHARLELHNRWRLSCLTHPPGNEGK